MNREVQNENLVVGIFCLIATPVIFWFAFRMTESNTEFMFCFLVGFGTLVLCINCLVNGFNPPDRRDKD